jgi:hypothetical protein
MRRNPSHFLLLATILVVSTPLLLAQTPDRGIYLGIWANPQLGSGQEAAIEVREGPAPNGINRTFALHLHYYSWTKLAGELDSAGVFHPDDDLLGDIAHGRIPVISWVCDGTVFNSDGLIAAGDPNEDANIMATASALAQYPGPVLLRWFWEFNRLGGNQNCRGDAGGTPTQQVYNDFIGAWRHIRQLFRQAGAANVLFLWNPGYYPADGDPTDPHNYYPGNGFVDWIGIDTYQRSTTATFADDFGLFYSDFSQDQYGHKPLMVGENASPNFTVHNLELQSTYLQGLLADVQAGLYPLLKAYCYFDSHPTGKTDNWILDDNNGQGNGGLAAFAIIGASREFSAMPASFIPPR